MSLTSDYQIFETYFPKGASTYCFDLWKKYRFTFKIAKPRQSKLGDYCFRKEQGHQISVNGNLNPYAFTITYIHEVAHLLTYKQYKKKQEPHGLAWKKNFKSLFEPLLSEAIFPNSVLLPLKQYLENPAASTQGCPALVSALRLFDATHNHSLVELMSLAEGQSFELQNRTFVKGTLRRTRFLCTELSSGKRYVVAAHALVKKL